MQYENFKFNSLPQYIFSGLAAAMFFLVQQPPSHFDRRGAASRRQLPAAKAAAAAGSLRSAYTSSSIRNSQFADLVIAILVDFLRSNDFTKIFRKFQK